MKKQFNEFKELFKKKEGFKVLKDYFQSHVLLFSLIESLIVGLDKKSLEIVRLAVSNKIYKRLKRKNKIIIDDFLKNNSNELDHEHPKIIWTIWLQGIDKAPLIVKKCYESMIKQLEAYSIILITENNYNNYISFPDFIMEKYRKGIISKVHFADLIRIELLCKYGGTWLDGTVYVSDFLEKHKFYLESDIFLYQLTKPGSDGHCTSISSWFMTSSSNQNIFLMVRELLHNYWKNNNRAEDYFILHDFFQMSIEALENDWKKVIPISNEIPHILLHKMFEQYDDNIWNQIKDITPFHKLTYKYDKNNEKIEGTFFKEIIEK